MNCSRCGSAFVPGDRYQSDPCCGASDCENGNDVSHTRCIPVMLRDDESHTYMGTADVRSRFCDNCKTSHTGNVPCLATR